MNKQLYVFKHLTAVSLGIGGGYIKEAKIWDFSLSLVFFTVGFRFWSKTSALEEMENESI